MEEEFEDECYLVPSDEEYDPEKEMERSNIKEEPIEGKPKTKKGAVKKKRVQINAAQKRILASHVRGHPEIWDLTNIQHQNNNAVHLAWTKIGTLMQKPGKSLIFIRLRLKINIKQRQILFFFRQIRC